ncbi:MAG TPA: hypothetical protein VMH61_07040 [Candidatus Acidoferrales bacterium]|nr:hypothetical protein [Candidatus Acidoferrales bacterium]
MSNGMVRALRIGAPMLLVLGTCGWGGCLGSPKITDEWTRVDLTSSNVSAFETMPLGAAESVHVHAQITFRAIVTGYAVAELRVSPNYTTENLPLSPNLPRTDLASDIDSLLAHSVTAGRAIRAVTGWDHLVQTIPLDFGTTVPAVLDTTGAGAGGLFFVCYLGSGVKIERVNMPDTIVITPFKSSAMRVLPMGMALQTATATP